MGVFVRVPVPFLSYTSAQAEVIVEGDTVQEVLENLNENHPGIMDKICDGNNNVRKFVNLYLNDRDIRSLGHLNTKVNNGDKILIVPSIAGG